MFGGCAVLQRSTRWLREGEGKGMEECGVKENMALAEGGRCAEMGLVTGRSGGGKDGKQWRI